MVHAFQERLLEQVWILCHSCVDGARNTFWHFLGLVFVMTTGTSKLLVLTLLVE
jgi:hypothetical protein